MTEGSSDRREPGSAPSLPPPQPSYQTSALFGERREVILVHNGEQYRLRMTQSGKLILTK